MSGRDAALAVILVTDHYATIRRTISCLRRQTVHDALEIVIVVGPRSAPELDDGETRAFACVRVVETGPLRSLRSPKAIGIAAATAPLVVLGESHCFPEPGWAEALIEAHRGPWAAVGPAIGNANPESAISWSNLLIDYGPWLSPHPGGPVDDLPGNNTSYKRSLLVAYGDALGDLLDSETILHRDLRTRGYALRLEPRATALHLNVDRLATWLPERFHAARAFASARARDWGPLRRAVYVGGAPLIPPLRLKRIIGDLQRAGLARRLLPRILPSLLLGLVASACGETVGYLSGAGRSVEKLAEYELHRERYVVPAAG